MKPRMKQSSSSTSEEDVPLKQRVKLKAQIVVKKAKKEVRKNTINMPVQAKSKKFVIPRNKKTRELLDVQGLESRDATELLRKVKQSFYQPDNISNYVFEDVTIVHNSHFNTEFSAKKQEMRQDGYAQKDLEDTFAYLYLDGWNKVRKMAKEGLHVGSSQFSSLGDPKMGVYVARYPDVVSPCSIQARTSKYLMVFKIAKGKLKAVGERTGDGCPLEPTPNYDGHISKSFPLAHNVSLEQAFTSSQYYFYEFADDGDDLHAKRPRQCCPYAVIQFSVTSSQPYHLSSRNILTQDSSLRNLPMPADSRNVSGQLVLLKKEKKSDTVPPVVDGRMYSNRSKLGRNLWSGVIKNKQNILSSADLICYSSDILPITIGGNIDIRGKVSFEKIKPSLPIFEQLPAFSSKCKAFNQTTMYLYCEIRPREKNNAKLAKLIKKLQQENLAGVAEYADSSAHIYVIPTSDFSHQLGLTDRYYPNMLHALIQKRIPKEDIQSYKKMTKISADPIAEAAVRRDIRKELRRIEIEKLKQREQSDSSSMASSDVEMSSGEDKTMSDAKRKETGVKSAAATGEKIKVDKENNTAAVHVGHKDGESISKDTEDSIDTGHAVQNEARVPEKASQDGGFPGTENVDRTTTSNDADEVLTDIHDNPENKIGDNVEVFKSPSLIQKHATVVDGTLLVGNEPRTNTVTRHFMDPRLGSKGDKFLVASPTEIELLSSDSGADTPQPSPISRHSRTNEMSAGVLLQSMDAIAECTDPTGIQIDETANVSRLSSRLVALFSQSGKRLPKNSASIATTISATTSSASSATSTISAVPVLPSFPVESGSTATTLTTTTTGHKLETVTSPLNILSSIPSQPSHFPPASHSELSSGRIVSVTKGKSKVVDSPNSTTYASLTYSQTSSFALAGSRISSYENKANVESSSNSRIDNLAVSKELHPKSEQSSLDTSNTHQKGIISFSRAKPTTQSGTFMFSPATLSSSVSHKEATKENRQATHLCKPQMKPRSGPSHESSRYDKTSPEGNHPQQLQIGDEIEPMETSDTSDTSDNSNMDWYDTVDTQHSEDVPKLSSALQARVTKTSYETSNRVSVSTQRVRNSPPLPTETPPPPPPPPLTSCYPPSTTSYPEAHSNRARPLSQDSSDLYEYGLTLSSSDHPPQDSGDLYFCKGNTPSGSSSRSSTPVVMLQEKQLNPGSVPQFSPTPTPTPTPPPPPPPPPLPPLLHMYNPARFHQDNYSTTCSTMYAHPAYSVMQPIPIVNSTLSGYRCPVSRNTGYTNFPPSLTKDFDNSAGFGYTKQITPLWNETSAGMCDEDQSLVTKHLDQHEFSSLKTKDKNTATTNSPGIKSSHLQLQKDPSSFEPRVEKDSVVTTGKTSSLLKPVSEDPLCSQAVVKRGEFASSDGVPRKKHVKEGSGTEQRIQFEEEIPAQLPTGEVIQDMVREIDTQRTGKQMLPSLGGAGPIIEQNKLSESTPSIKFSVNLEERKSFSKTNSLNRTEVTDLLREKNNNLTSRNVSGINRSTHVTGFLDSNDETYEEIPLSDEEIPCSKPDKKSELIRAGKDRNQKTGSKGNDGSSDCQSALSDYVDSNDETFVEIPISKTAIGRRKSGFGEGVMDKDDEWQMECNTDLSKESFTGRKKEVYSDLREVIKEKKRKYSTDDSEKLSTSRNRRRVVEIVTREPVVPGDTTLKPSDRPGETLRSANSPNPGSDDIIQDRFKSFLENRRKMTSPDSESCHSTPDDHIQTLEEIRRRMSSPDFGKKRRSTSPETESRTSSPDWNSSERRRRQYNRRRRAGSSDDSRTESSTGSRPGSSASSRATVSRPGSRVSQRTRSHAQVERSTKRYPPPKRARVQKGTSGKISRDETLSDHVSDEECSTPGRGLDNDFPGDVLGGGLDDKYTGKSPVDSRQERQGSPGKKHHRYVTARDSSTAPSRRSPARESRFQPRYGITRYNARGSGSESGSRRAKHSDRNNNNWSRHNDRSDVNEKTKNQLDFPDAILPKLIRTELIERMQRHVHKDLQRTLNGNPDCLDEPDGKKQKPFFGGIGQYIYAKKDEEESRCEEDRTYRSGLETSTRVGRSRAGLSGDHQGEGTVTAPNSIVNFQSLGSKAKQNVQRDVKNINDFVNVKEFDDVFSACESEENESEENESVSTAPEPMQNNQTRSEFSKSFIVQFKEKRRRVLLDKLRNLRDKEKIGSCAILLAQLEKLKRDVRKLSSAKLRRSYMAEKGTGEKENMSHNNSKSNEVQKTNDATNQLHNATGLASVNVAGGEMIDMLDLEKCEVDRTSQENTTNALSGLHETVGIAVQSVSTRKNINESTGCNVTAMETNSTNNAGLDDRTKKRHKILDRQVPSIGRMQMHRGSSSAPSQDLTEVVEDINVEDYDNLKLDNQSLPTTKLSSDSNRPDNDRNLIGKIDRNREHKPDDFVDRTSCIVLDSPAIRALKPSNIHLQKDQSTASTRGKRGGRISEGTKERENENILVRSGYKDREYTGGRNCTDSKYEKITNVNIPEHGSDKPEKSNKRAVGPSYSDFDFIAHRAKREFKFELMIKSQKLFPKLLSDLPIDRENQQKSKERSNTHKNGNRTNASRKLDVELDDKTCHRDLPVTQPSQSACRQLSEEENLERRLLHVLNSLTKSQLNILRAGSPTARLRGQVRSTSSSPPPDSPNV